jgi:hypothetical protein
VNTPGRCRRRAAFREIQHWQPAVPDYFAVKRASMGRDADHRSESNAGAEPLDYSSF